MSILVIFDFSDPHIRKADEINQFTQWCRRYFKVNSAAADSPIPMIDRIAEMKEFYLREYRVVFECMCDNNSTDGYDPDLQRVSYEFESEEHKVEFMLKFL